MTKIEWTHAPGYKGESWNPIVGCSVVSPGCTNCYAMMQAARIERMTPGTHYAGTTTMVNGNHVWTGKVARAPEKTLRRPIGQKKPRMYFVNSMSDLFHESVPDEWIDDIFAAMILAPQHLFLVLTKRTDRMRHYMNDPELGAKHCAAAFHLLGDRDPGPAPGWPIPNIWLGATTEDQLRANARIPDLLMTPAAKHFVSYEPALGPVDFTRIDSAAGARFRTFEAFQGLDSKDVAQVSHGIDWVIAGGESGLRARPVDPDWFRVVGNQCAAAGVPFFFKQWGEWMPVARTEGGATAMRPERLPPGAGEEVEVGSWIMRRVGKKAAGAEFEGRLRQEWPL